MPKIVRELGTARGIRPEWRRALLEPLGALHLPMLIIWGDHDEILPPSHMRVAAAAFPDADTQVFPDTGHMPQVERPNDFAALVETFLAAVHLKVRSHG